MTFELEWLLAAAMLYLLLLFFVAKGVERGIIPDRLVRHPSVYVLSLGVYASSWAFYGSVSLANEFGFAFMAYYLGISGAFLLAPVMLKPLMRITQHFQLTSLADLFAFRFRSRIAGALVTLSMLLATLPLISLQITTVAESAALLSGQHDNHPIQWAFVFSLLMICFALLFGAGRLSPREKQASLVAAMAFETLVKIAVLAVLAGVILWQVFDGWHGLNQWLLQQPAAQNPLSKKLEAGPWRTLLLLFFAAAVVMPHMFHLTFTEHLNANGLKKASWGIPLIMLLMCSVIPLILWAGLYLDAPTEPEYFAIGIGMALNSPSLSLLVFIGGIAAGSGIVIVTALAMASMCLNHLVLPTYQPQADSNVYRWLLWARRGLITALILAGFGVYVLVEDSLNLARLGVIAYVATLQFFPGVLGLLYWPNGNKQGFLSGLAIGMLAWLVLVTLPIFDIPLPFGLFANLTPEQFWYQAATIAVGLNFATFIGVSLLTTTREEERETAEACSIDALSTPQRLDLQVDTARDFIHKLAIPLGQDMARREVEQALKDLQLSPEESRPYALRRLRSRLEANLSGLLGPSVAYSVLQNHVPFSNSGQQAADDIQYIEAGLETYHHRFTGLAAELDNLRRYHRRLLEQLPMAACSLSSSGEILMWNQAMVDITQVPAHLVTGANMRTLPNPWRILIQDFAHDHATHVHKRHLEIEGRPHWFNLHKSDIRQSGSRHQDGQLILLEDLTENQLLEAELVHSERLASIGRLAAGVAHEIGNPVTGIACLAQNLKYESDSNAIGAVGQQILEQTQRVTRIVESLVNFSHSGANSASQLTDRVNLKECVQEAVHLLSLNRGRGVTVNNGLPEQLWVQGDPQRLMQVFVNLLSNAYDACGDNGIVELQGQVGDHQVTLQLSDNGCGIDPEVMEQIFEPFFTTKEVGEGTGLGLAMVYSIVEEHFGHIRFDSPTLPNGGGTQVTLTLPNAPEARQDDW